MSGFNRPETCHRSLKHYKVQHEAGFGPQLCFFALKQSEGTVFVAVYKIS